MTLVEVLIVLAIIGILANVAYPQLDSALWKSRAAVVIADYRLFEGAVVDYMSVHGVYPTQRLGRQSGRRVRGLHAAGLQVDQASTVGLRLRLGELGEQGARSAIEHRVRILVEAARREAGVGHRAAL
jgi:prepilin-type N-terminal cleavage/methylation domain-containing protein